MKNKITLILAFIILVGLIIIATLGFELDKNYNSYNLMEISIEKEFNISDIEGITKEALPNAKVEIQKSGAFNDNVIIKVKGDVTDEQKNTLNTKLNEKYGLDNTAENITVSSVPKMKVIDMIKPYLIPILVITGLVLIYMIIRYRNIGVAKVFCQTIILTLMAELLYFSLIAITRFQVNSLLMPGALVIYIAMLTVLTYMFEKQISVEKQK